LCFVVVVVVEGNFLCWNATSCIWL
jgi:hypothetical protein